MNVCIDLDYLFVLFQNLKPTFPTMQQPLSDITGGTLSGNFSLELPKALYDFIQSRPVNTLKWVKLVELPFKNSPQMNEKRLNMTCNELSQLISFITSAQLLCNVRHNSD